MAGKVKARIYCENLEAQLSLSKEHSHYLMNVLRCDKGDHIGIFNATQGEWCFEITAYIHKQVIATQRSQIKAPITPCDHLWLAFAPMKKTRLIFLAEKACELGVNQIFPVITEHSDIRKIPEARFQANMVEAAEQCERLDIPQLHDIQKLDTFLESLPDDRLLLVCAESNAQETLFDFLTSPTFTTQKVAILVGPIGGFSPDEFARLSQREHTKLISLGDHILRAETAAIAAISCWQSIKGAWR